jgi:predicted MFS family arabinose efflux permease
MSTQTLAHQQANSSYRWVMLVLCALTPMFVVTLPGMSLPPLFSTIAADLNMTLVEIGIVWGSISFMGIFFSVIGGTLGDRFGTRATLFTTCFLTGVFGLLRSLAVDFSSLMVTTLLMGAFQAVLPVIVFKVARDWFPSHQLGMASGVISAGFAAGLTMGPLLSTSVILPVLGGWQQVLIFYGVLAMILGVLWWFLHPVTPQGEKHGSRVSLLDSLRHVIVMPHIWILGVAGLGINGMFGGFTGYLPTYLKAVGWAELDADRALSAFFVTSLLMVVPLSILSDRFRLRRGFLIFSALLLALGVGSVTFLEGALILIAIAIAGSVFDSFMAILNASVMEIEGIGHIYAGTAIGFSTMIRNMGGTFSPAVGNSLTAYGDQIPFLFWSGMGLFAVLIFIFVYHPKKSQAAA